MFHEGNYFIVNSEIRKMLTGSLRFYDFICSRLYLDGINELTG